MKFPWCFNKKVSSVLQKSVWCVLRKFQGCVESISRVKQDSFEDVLGVFLRVFEATSTGVIKQFRGSFQRVSSKFLGVSLKFQECFKSVLKKHYGNIKSVSQKLQGVLRKFHGCFREISRMFQECFTSDSRRFQKSL